jgi:hypothetical protein
MIPAVVEAVETKPQAETEPAIEERIVVAVEEGIVPAIAERIVGIEGVPAGRAGIDPVVVPVEVAPILVRTPVVVLVVVPRDYGRITVFVDFDVIRFRLVIGPLYDGQLRIAAGESEENKPEQDQANRGRKRKCAGRCGGGRSFHDKLQFWMGGNSKLRADNGSYAGAPSKFSTISGPAFSRISTLPRPCRRQANRLHLSNIKAPDSDSNERPRRRCLCITAGPRVYSCFRRARAEHRFCAIAGL